jgi:predicted transcriptional regulator
MYWDRIEAEWSKMACRVSGRGALPTTAEMRSFSDAQIDAGLADADADPVAVTESEMPDRIVA